MGFVSAIRNLFAGSPATSSTASTPSLTPAAATATYAPSAPLEPSLPISRAAYDLIVRFETGGRAYYAKACASPHWPGYSSGVTIGFGFDLAYNSADDLHAAWHMLPLDQRKRLANTIGLKGDAAKAAARAMRDIVIPWEVAEQVFRATTLPKFVALTRKAFPGSDQLPPDLLGVLVSLAYNRGTSMSGDSRREMARIRDLVLERHYGMVPAQIRSMKRLWAPGDPEQGLHARREAEADLWEDGLAGTAVS